MRQFSVSKWSVSRMTVAAMCLLAVIVLGSDVVQSLGLPAVSRVSAQDDAAPVAEAPAEDAPQEAESFLMFFFKALGWRYTLAFGFISFTFVAVLVMNLLSFRRDQIVPKHLVDGFEANLNEKKFQEAFDLAKNDDSMLGRMLSAGMGKLQQGYDKALESVGEVGEDEAMKLEHRLSYVSLVASIAPMVGLLGTVDGMVKSFQVIANSSSQPKPSELAQGISMALVTTLVGLVLAIPAIIAFNLLKNRLTRMTMEVGQTVGNLMSRFETMGKK